MFMTGKELIIYILQNNLEDEDIFKDGVFSGFMSEEEMAVSWEVGVATIRAAYKLGFFKGFEINDSIFFLKGEEKKRGLSNEQ